MPVPQCPGGHVASFSLAGYRPGRPSRWPLPLLTGIGAPESERTRYRLDPYLQAPFGVHLNPKMGYKNFAKVYLLRARLSAML
jgi:hypothetical protein